MSDFNLDTDPGRLEAIRRMVAIREFDSTAAERFADDDIPGFVHLCVGQEAVAVGTCGALSPKDYIASHHRGHGHCIAMGLDPRTMMAELYGKRDGYCIGKGGSMHLADIDAGMLGANGIVGGGSPLATGAALTIDYQDLDRVSLAFCGDGGVAQGQFHEAANLAATWNLPVIYLIENNQYGEGTPVAEQHNIENLSDTAKAYDVPGVTVDGMDVIAVYEAVVEARERARAGDGPTIIEAETYRYFGHYEGDHESYRTEDEIERWKERDPIESFKERLLNRGELTDEQFEDLQIEAESLIEDAVEYADSAEAPDPSEAYDNMFAEQPPEIEKFAKRLRVDGGVRYNRRCF